MLKDNKGITLISLVITIIVLIILASVATVSGTGAIDYIKFNNAKAQFETMQSHVNSWYEEYKGIADNIDKNDSLTDEEKTEQKQAWLSNYGKDITESDETIRNQTLNGEEATGYRYFKSDYIKNNLDIDGISHDFLINISSRKVLLFSGITYNGKTYYSAEDFGINVVDYEELSGDITFDKTIKDKYIIIYNIQFSDDINISKYEVQYQLKGDKYWTTLTSDMKGTYEYKDEESGNTIKDDNAWYILFEEFWTYNLKISTASETLNKQDSISTGYVYKKDEKGRKTIVTNGTIELKIGDYINYNAAAIDANETETEEKTVTSETGTYVSGYVTAIESPEEGSGYSSDQEFSNETDTNGWRVLGVDEEKGEILLISADPIKTTENADFNIRGYTGYQYGEAQLDKVCAVFGYGYGATGARSVDVDDVNKITGYNPNNIGVYDPDQTEIGTKYGKDALDEYGNKVTYSWTTEKNKVQAVGTNGVTGQGSNDGYGTRKFNWYDNLTKTWKNSVQETTAPKEIVTIESSMYQYYPNTLTSESSGTEVGIGTTSQEYKTVFCNSSGSKTSYWLADSCIESNAESVNYCLRRVSSSGYVYRYGLYYSYGGQDGSARARAVVSLKSNIILQEASEGETYDYDIIG